MELLIWLGALNFALLVIVVVAVVQVALEVRSMKTALWGMNGKRKGVLDELTEDIKAARADLKGEVDSLRATRHEHRNLLNKLQAQVGLLVKWFNNHSAASFKIPED